MIINNKLIGIFQDVVNYGNRDKISDKDKILELAKILKIDWAKKTIKGNTTNFFTQAKKIIHLDRKQSEKILKWCESHVYEFPSNPKHKTIARGKVDGKIVSSIVTHRIIDVLFDEMLNNIEFDDMSKVSFQTVDLGKVQNAKAN